MILVDQLDAIALFERSFSRAVEANGVIDQALAVAGWPVVVRYAGSQIQEAFAQSFTHLESEAEATPELTISVWDGADPNAGPPPLPYLPPQAQFGDRAIFRSDDLRLIYHIGPSMLTALAPGRGLAWVWIAARSDIPFWEKAAPFSVVWRWWLAELGYTMLHAGAVATDDGGVLLVGKGGSGKSTGAIACLEDGFLYAGDDYVVLDPDCATIHSLYCTGKLEHEHSERFDGVQRNYIGTGEGRRGTSSTIYKRVLQLVDAHPGRVVPGLRIDAIVAPVLRLDRFESSFQTIAAMEAMRETAPSSMIQLPDGCQRDLAAMAHLVRRMPAYSLELGSEVGRIPGAVRRLLAEVRGG